MTLRSEEIFAAVSRVDDRINALVAENATLTARIKEQEGGLRHIADVVDQREGVFLRLSEIASTAASLLSGGGGSEERPLHGSDTGATPEALPAGKYKALPSDWRPIETAPKDGTWVLLFGGPQRALIVGPEAIGSYVGNYWKDTHGYTVEPTHWMPLPSPPCVSMPGDVSATGGSTLGRQGTDPGLSSSQDRGES